MQYERSPDKIVFCLLTLLFIPGGVTMYLTVEAVDETFSFIQKNSFKGGSVVF